MRDFIRRSLFRVKIGFSYLLVKIKFIQNLLPKQLRDRLPSGWNNQMFWMAFKSGGNKIYADYCCSMSTPDSYQPKVEVEKQYRFSEEEIKFFYENGYIGPFDLVPQEQIKNLKTNFLDIIHNRESEVYSYSQGDFQVKAGQFFIFTERVIHGALKNQTQDARWSISARIARPDTIIYSQKMRAEGHSFRILNITNLKLDKWRAVMIRGRDCFGYNRAVPEATRQGETVYAN